MVPQLVEGYQKVARAAAEKDRVRKERREKMKTYTCEEIMAGDSSSDGEEPTGDQKMGHFPWLKEGY